MLNGLNAGANPLFTQFCGHNLKVITNPTGSSLMLDLSGDAHGPTSLPGSSHPATNGTIPGLDGGV